MHQFFHYLYVAAWDFGKYVWPALGPLVGVLIGAWLSRSWDSKKWERDNRKEKCRELIKCISHAATEILNVGTGSSGREAHEAYLASIKIFHGTVFIAKEVDRQKILDKWAYAVSDLGAHKISAVEFSDRVAEIRKTIIGFVIPKG